MTGVLVSRPTRGAVRTDTVHTRVNAINYAKAFSYEKSRQRFLTQVKIIVILFKVKHWQVNVKGELSREEDSLNSNLI